MKKLAITCLIAAATVTGAYAATTLSAAPNESWTVTNYYKQNVYGSSESKIGTIDDVLLDKSGKVTGLVVGVGGFLGGGEKDVIVPFNSVKREKKMISGGSRSLQPRTNCKTRPVLLTTEQARHGCRRRSSGAAEIY